MSFNIETLDESVNFDDAVSSPQWIVGSNQTIYWKNCFVWVYKSSDRNVQVDKNGTCDGKGTVQKGTDIFLGGKGGKVKM